MTNYSYQKHGGLSPRLILRVFSAILSTTGLLAVLYVFAPMVLWQVYFFPAFAQKNLETPIPKTTVISSTLLKNIFSSGTEENGIDYTNAQNWYPGLVLKDAKKTKGVSSYSLSIPVLHIDHAVVSTIDNDLSNHLVNYAGTAIPADKGNAVIFGHSTLPQLFDPHNYKTIFANAYLLKTGDMLSAQIGNISYSYTIYSISITDPQDTAFFSQNNNDSQLTLVTCTPPGTTWKRLIIKARLKSI